MDRIQPPEIFERIYGRHGHRCPMSTLGGRLGLAARTLIGVQSRGESAVYLHDTCAVDGIELTTGCTRADGSLTIDPVGRHALVVTGGDGRTLRLELNENALAIAWEYRTIDDAFTAGRGTLPPDELQALHDKKETVLQSVLERLWTLPDTDLLTIEWDNA